MGERVDGGGVDMGATGIPLRVEQQEGTRLHGPTSPSSESVEFVRRAVGLVEQRLLQSHICKIADVSAGARHLT